MVVTFPQWLYHGTTANFLQSFKRQLIDKQYWKPGKDFGPGFYTTIDLPQAQEWAIKQSEDSFGLYDPCVLQMGVNLEAVKQMTLQHEIFLGPSREWAEYILDHRTMKEEDPCVSKKDRQLNQHCHVITGPMADGDTGDIVDDLQKNGYDVDWFYNEIMLSKKKEKKYGLALGNQISFHDEDSAKAIIQLDGAWLYEEEEWNYYDIKQL